MAKQELVCYKLFSVRKDGTIGPLFINRKQRLPLGEWLVAEEHPTKGYTYRPGWHCTSSPSANHLSPKGRQWYVVEIQDYTELRRPAHQGGTWYLANKMKILQPYML